jgi:ribosome recycling factor
VIILVQKNFVSQNFMFFKSILNVRIVPQYRWARSLASKKQKTIDTPSAPFDISQFSNRMQKSIDALKQILDKIRVGRANPSLLDSISVTLDGKQTLLSKVAQIHVKDAHTLMVVVAEEQLLKVVEKSLRSSSLGLNPQKQDQTALKVPIPKLSGDFKKQMIKNIHQSCERTRVSIRNVRQDARKLLKQAEYSANESKALEKKVQDETDGFIKNVDSLMQTKEKELQNI